MNHEKLDLSQDQLRLWQEQLQAKSERLESLRTALAELGCYDKDRRTGEIHPNSLWIDMGYNAEDLMDNRWLEFVHPDDLDYVRQKMDDMERGLTRELKAEFRVRDRWGNWRWIMSTARTIERDEEGRLLRYAGIDLDIDLRKRAEDEARKAWAEAEQRAREAEILRRMVGVVNSTLNPEEAVHRVLRLANRVVACDLAQVFIRKGDELWVVGSHGDSTEDGRQLRLASDSPEATVMERKKPMTTLMDGESEDQSEAWLGLPLVAHAECIGILTMRRQEPFTRDQVQLASAFADHVAIGLFNAHLHEETKLMAITDSLTGLYSRRWFFSHGETQIEQARRRGRELAIIMIDLDHFKKVNDTFGHAAGDRILRESADRCVESVRGFDVACRFGGEEFVILLPETGRMEAEKIAARLREAIASVPLPEGEGHLSASLGVAILDPTETEGLASIIERADTALYRAKNLGRDRVCID